jgi:putative heme transporter
MTADQASQSPMRPQPASGPGSRTGFVPSRQAGPAAPAIPGPSPPGAALTRFRGRKLLGSAASVLLVAGIFWFAIPRFASYRSVWADVETMGWPQILLVAAAAVASLVCGWAVICAVLPEVRLREAAVVNLGSTAVANTLPAGGALAMGVSWAMLRGWGVSAADYVLYTLVSGIWNVFARLSLPVIALVVLLTASRPAAGLEAGAIAGLALLAVVAGGFALMLRSEDFARRADAALRRVVAAGCRVARKPPPPAAGWLLDFRARAAGVLAARGWRITAATAAGNVALWLVLLASMHAVGVGQSEVPWQTSLAAFAFVRLLTVLPVTPGGAGITELGLVGILAAGASHHVAAQVTAAVLLYRAVTYLAPIPAGAIACLAWRYAPALRRAATPETRTSSPGVQVPDARTVRKEVFSAERAAGGRP